MVLLICLGGACSGIPGARFEISGNRFAGQSLSFPSRRSLQKRLATLDGSSPFWDTFVNRMEQKEVNIHLLMRRLARCPAELYDFPNESVVPLAVVQDTVFHLGGPALSASIRKAITSEKASGRMPFMLLACYVLADPMFSGRKDLLPRALELLGQGFMELSAVARAPDFVSDTRQ